MILHLPLHSLSSITKVCTAMGPVYSYRWSTLFSANLYECYSANRHEDDAKYAEREWERYLVEKHLGSRVVRLRRIVS